MIKMEQHTIDLTQLHCNVEEKIDITGMYNIPKEYLENSEIIKADNLSVIGKIFRKENEDFELEDYIECTIEGEIIIPDSISLEEVNYPITVKYSDFIEENYRNNQNTLDIFRFIWENIELEVPLQFTKVEDLSKFHGDGWKLISEDELKLNNSPFSNLLNIIEKE